MSDNSNGELLKFPCDFVIKIFGVASDEFIPTILGLVRKHIPDLSDSAVSVRPSKNNKYTAVSLTVPVASREQLDTIYKELTSSPVVLMAL